MCPFSGEPSKLMGVPVEFPFKTTLKGVPSKKTHRHEPLGFSVPAKKRRRRAQPLRHPATPPRTTQPNRPEAQVAIEALASALVVLAAPRLLGAGPVDVPVGVPEKEKKKI